MKVLWFCNVQFSKEKIKASGTWLFPMAKGLVENKNVELYTVCESRNINEIIREDIDGIHQYIIPWKKRKRYIQNLPSNKSCLYVRDIIKEVRPDLIHIWGTESVWAYMNCLHVFDSFKTLLEIQGLSSSYYYYYYGGMNFGDRLESIGLNEVLHPWKLLEFNKFQFFRRGKVEVKAIKSFKHISFQSEWVKMELKRIKPEACLHATNIMLRDSFYSASPWFSFHHEDKPIVFSICAGPTPYKGTDILIKAIGELKNDYPNIELRLAGISPNKRNGLTSFYLKTVHRMNLENNVSFLGAINEYDIVNELQHANVTVVPSFVETYCLAFAESMMIGVPTVAARSAALPYLGEDMEEALFYSPKDYKECSDRIKLLLEDHSLSNRISRKGRERRLKENDREMVLDTQYSIYKKILNE